MNQFPLISVIIPIYNTNLFFLERCFKSINEQSFKNLEIIIVDSSDNIEVQNYLQNFVFERIPVEIIRSNKGVSLQRNLGIEKSNGDFIAFIDSDDFINKDYFSELITSIQRDNFDISYPLIEKQIFRDNKIIKTWEFKHKDFEFYLNSENYFEFSLNNAFVHPVKLYKKSLIGTTRFDTQLAFGEDLIFNYELSSKQPRVTFSKKAIYSYSSEESTNLIKRHLSTSIFRFLNRLISIYRIHKKQKKNYSNILPFYNEPFLNFYYYAWKHFSIKWIILSLKHRIFYFSHNHSFKNFIYMFFPLSLFVIKKLLRRI